MEEFEDRLLTCEDCGAQFVFSAKEQAYYKEKGFAHPPKRCRQCRQARKASREAGSGRQRAPQSGGQGGAADRPYRQNGGQAESLSAAAGGNAVPSQEREMFTVTCSECGAQASVPFRPDPNRPVYCRACYAAKKKQRTENL
jgi:CxxC-x17-CxxC domain-containing protein